MAVFPKDGIKYPPKKNKDSNAAEVPASLSIVLKNERTFWYFPYIGRWLVSNSHIGCFCSVVLYLVSGPTNHLADRVSSHLFVSLWFTHKRTVAKLKPTRVQFLALDSSPAY
jgi:hypothetical protein